MIEQFKIIKIRGTTREIVEDLVAEEVPLTLMVGNKELVTLLCMPSDLEELIIGFLFTSGLIKKMEDIKKIVINQSQWTAYIDLNVGDISIVFKRLYTSGCGRGTLFYNAADIVNRPKIISDFKIEVVNVSRLMADFQRRSGIYLRTGGVHSAALTDEKNILIFKEDIGRHNAIDKVIGYALKHGDSFENKSLISSGRISSEVLFKIQKARIPVVISQSAPTNQAVKLAKDMDITLVGFARGSRMNIYSKEDRILHGGI